MLRAALLAFLLLLPGTSSAAQTADEAYEACLFGHAVLGVLQLEMSPWDAYERAYGKCSDVAATVPDDVCSEEADACGPVAVSEYVIHVWESVVAPALIEEPGTPLRAPESVF